MDFTRQPNHSRDYLRARGFRAAAIGEGYVWGVWLGFQREADRPGYERGYAGEADRKRCAIDHRSVGLVVYLQQLPRLARAG